MKKLLIRAASGVIYVAAIVGSLALGSWYFVGLMLFFALVGTTEYQHIMAMRNGRQLPVVIRVLDILAALSAVLLPAATTLLSEGVERGLICGLASYVLVRFICAILQKKGDPVAEAAQSLMGVVYIAGALGLLSGYSLYDGLSPYVIFAMFVLIWLNDTGAFCAGSLFGRRRLCERLSPKKSWEGFWGGLLLCVAVAVVYAAMAGDEYIRSIIFALIVSIFSTLGDLFESMLKRSAGVKDSGRLIPGHGGILDRIDSTLFVAPAILLYLIFVWP